MSEGNSESAWFSGIYDVEAFIMLTQRLLAWGNVYVLGARALSLVPELGFQGFVPELTHLHSD